MWIIAIILSFTFFLLGGNTTAVSQTLPKEDIWFSTNKEHYSLGDTISYSGIIERTDSVGPFFSRYAYIELFNDEDSLFIRHKVSVNEKGQFKNIIPLEGITDVGNYRMRAYTRFMLNFPTSTIPTRLVNIGDSLKINSSNNKLYAFFYPEGGHFVADNIQNMSIYLCNETGNPIQNKFIIQDEEGILIAQGETSLEGWSICSFIPLQNKTYTLRTETSEKTFSFPLPDTEKTPTLRCVINNGQLHYIIIGNQKAKYKNLCIYNQRIGLLKWKSTGEKGHLFTDELPSSGILHVLLLDNNENIISENSILLGADDNGYENLTSELSADLPCPTQDKNDIQAWLYAAKFNQFSVKQVLNEGFKYKYKPEVQLELKGRVQKKTSNWPIKNGTIIAFRRSDGKTYESSTNSRGEFCIPVDDFFNDETFFIQAYDKNGKTELYDYVFTNDTLPRFHHKRTLLTNHGITTSKKNKNRENFTFTGINELPEVIIKSKILIQPKPQAKSSLDEARYLDSKKIKERNYQILDQFLNYFFVFAHLQWSEEIDERTGIVIKKTPHFLINRSSTLTGGEIKILLDGKEVQLSEIYNTINPTTIESMELLTPSQALAYVSGAAEGALLIKTTSGKRESMHSKGVLFRPSIGLTPPI